MNAALSALRPSWVKKIEVTRVANCPVPGDCWLWRGARDKKSGYGRIQRDGQLKYAHRVVYEILVGSIPTGLQIDHLCRQRACCAPHHLEPVTCLVNNRRGLGGASRSRCPSGHAYAGDNLYTWTDARGYTRRYCRRCAAAHGVTFRARRAAAALKVPA